MAHLTSRSSYADLAERYNRYPQGAPASETLFKILEMLFTQREAELAAQLPIKHFTASRAAEIWNVPLAEAQRLLDDLADRGLLLDFDRGKRWEYVLAPPMAGFLEFLFMRVRGDVDQARLAELLHEYSDIEDGFVTALFGKDTQFSRVLPSEQALAKSPSLQILDYERASHIIENSGNLSLGMCYCRHKQQHLGAACDAPMEACFTINTIAESLIRHGVARPVEKDRALDIIEEAREHDLVQVVENVRRGPGFLCNCCACCCGMLNATRRFGFLHAITSTSYLPEVEVERCKGCGECVNSCPVEALYLVSANLPDKRRRKARVRPEECLGCGVCVRHCKRECIKLVERRQRVIPPLTSTHRVVVMAIERGLLADLLFDDRSLTSHRTMAAVLSTVLKLPPLERILASKQVKSRYLERLLSKT